MSWAEVSKINNDFSIPINLAMLINHIDLIGNEYNPLLDIENTKSMLGAEVTYSHKIASTILSKGFWDYILNGGSTNVGRDINQTFKIGRTDFEQYSTVADLFGEPERVFTVAKYGGRSALVSSFLSNLLDYNGFVSGILSTYKNTLMLYNSIKDESILPINAIRNSTIAFEELHSSKQLVLLDTVGEGTYVIPDGVTSILVAAISGGGGGGNGGHGYGGNGGDDGGASGAVSNNGGGTGGGGGAYRMHVVQVSPGQSYPYVVGDGGNANTAGEASRFNSIQGERFIEQKYVLPNSSGSSSTHGTSYGGSGGAAGGTGGNASASGGAGGGGFGGGDGIATAYSGGVGKGGLTYGTGGGGTSGTGQGNSTRSGGGGGGYGGGGGGGGGLKAGGKGGQGIIALYLGREAYIA